MCPFRQYNQLVALLFHFVAVSHKCKNTIFCEVVVTNLLCPVIVLYPRFSRVTFVYGLRPLYDNPIIKQYSRQSSNTKCLLTLSLLFLKVNSPHNGKDHALMRTSTVEFFLMLIMLSGDSHLCT